MTVRKKNENSTFVNVSLMKMNDPEFSSMIEFLRDSLSRRVAGVKISDRAIVRLAIERLVADVKNGSV